MNGCPVQEHVRCQLQSLMFGIIGTIANGGGLAVDVTQTPEEWCIRLLMGGGGPSGGGGASCELCELDGPMRGGGVLCLVWTTFFDGGALAMG